MPKGQLSLYFSIGKIVTFPEVSLSGLLLTSDLPELNQMAILPSRKYALFLLGILSPWKIEVLTVRSKDQNNDYSVSNYQYLQHETYNLYSLEYTINKWEGGSLRTFPQIAQNFFQRNKEWNEIIWVKSLRGVRKFPRDIWRTSGTKLLLFWFKQTNKNMYPIRDA